MVPILSVVGTSGSGKTAIVEALVKELTSRGLAIGTVKHGGHGFDLDQPGKDTWRHREAGARVVVAASPGRIALQLETEGDPDLQEIRERFIPPGLDLVIAEGFKTRNPFPKIEAAIFTPQDAPLLFAGDTSLLAVVSPSPRRSEPAPCLLPDQIPALADMVQSSLLEGRTSHRDEFTIRVNGRRIPMNAFVRRILQSGILGMLGELKECEDARSVDISIRRGQ